MELKKNINGSTIVIVIVTTFILMYVGISLAASNAQSLINSVNLSKSKVAYSEAEGNIEEALYIYSGHDIGFEITSSGTGNNPTNDNICDNDDDWCLETRIHEAIETYLYKNDLFRIGMYNDTAGPYEDPNNQNIPIDIQNPLEMKMWNEGDGNIQVSAGDYRVTSFGGFTAGSQVSSNDLDAHPSFPTYLRPLTFDDYKISGNDGIWEQNNVVYLDIDNNNKVNAGDLRITAYLDQAANTTVQPTDEDACNDPDNYPTCSGINLFTPLNLAFKCNMIQNACSSIDENQIYSTKIGSISIIYRENGEAKKWEYTISKNNIDQIVSKQAASSTANFPSMINKDTLSNTNIEDIAPTSIEDLFGLGTIEQPILQISSINQPFSLEVNYDYNDADHSLRLARTVTTLKAKSREGNNQKGVEMELERNEIIPIFGIGDVVY